MGDVKTMLVASLSPNPFGVIDSGLPCPASGVSLSGVDLVSILAENDHVRAVVVGNKASFCVGVRGSQVSIFSSESADLGVASLSFIGARREDQANEGDTYAAARAGTPQALKVTVTMRLWASIIADAVFHLSSLAVS